MSKYTSKAKISISINDCKSITLELNKYFSKTDNLKRNEYIFEVITDAYEGLEENLRSMLKTLLNFKKEIINSQQKQGCEFHISILISKMKLNDVGVDLNIEILKMIVELNMEVSINVYDKGFLDF